MGQKTQDLPHIGVRKKWARSGRTVAWPADLEKDNPPGATTFASVRKAKRFMRTGSPDRRS